MTGSILGENQHQGINISSKRYEARGKIEVTSTVNTGGGHEKKSKILQRERCRRGALHELYEEGNDEEKIQKTKGRAVWIESTGPNQTESPYKYTRVAVWKVYTRNQDEEGRGGCKKDSQGESFGRSGSSSGGTQKKKHIGAQKKIQRKRKKVRENKQNLPINEGKKKVQETTQERFLSRGKFRFINSKRGIWLALNGKTAKEITSTEPLGKT